MQAIKYIAQPLCLAAFGREQLKLLNHRRYEMSSCNCHRRHAGWERRTATDRKGSWVSMW